MFHYFTSILIALFAGSMHVPSLRRLTYKRLRADQGLDPPLNFWSAVDHHHIVTLTLPRPNVSTLEAITLLSSYGSIGPQLRPVSALVAFAYSHHISTSTVFLKEDAARQAKPSASINSTTASVKKRRSRGLSWQQLCLRTLQIIHQSTFRRRPRVPRAGSAQLRKTIRKAIRTTPRMQRLTLQQSECAYSPSLSSSKNTPEKR